MGSEKRFFGTNVYDEAKARIRIAFGNFDKVCVSFSGGKDSTVLTHLTIEVAREMDRLPIDVLVIDLEGQYAATMDHVAEIVAMPEVRPHRVCLPLNLPNASSATAPYWTCWDPDAKDRWVCLMPEAAGVISDPAHFPWFESGMESEQFVPRFNEWIAGDGAAACLVGIPDIAILASAMETETETGGRGRQSVEDKIEYGYGLMETVAPITDLGRLQNEGVTRMVVEGWKMLAARVGGSTTVQEFINANRP